MSQSGCPQQSRISRQKISSYKTENGIEKLDSPVVDPIPSLDIESDNSVSDGSHHSDRVSKTNSTSSPPIDVTEQQGNRFSVALASKIVENNANDHELVNLKKKENGGKNSFRKKKSDCENFTETQRNTNNDYSASVDQRLGRAKNGAILSIFKKLQTSFIEDGTSDDVPFVHAALPHQSASSQNCKLCGRQVPAQARALLCDNCHDWTHISCLKTNVWIKEVGVINVRKEYERLMDLESFSWVCPKCEKSVYPSRIQRCEERPLLDRTKCSITVPPKITDVVRKTLTESQLETDNAPGVKEASQRRREESESLGGDDSGSDSWAIHPTRGNRVGKESVVTLRSNGTGFTDVNVDTSVENDGNVGITNPVTGGFKGNDESFARSDRQLSANYDDPVVASDRNNFAALGQNPVNESSRQSSPDDDVEVLYVESFLTEKKHDCFLCDAKFCLRDNLLTHFASHVEKLVRCDFCLETFSTTKKTSDHFLAIHGLFERLSCDVCARSFWLERDLKRHKRLHLE